MLHEYWHSLDKQNAQIQKSPYQIESLQFESSNHKKFLLVTHEFSRTGAPYAVLYLARALFSISGVKPIVLSAKDGMIRKEFEEEGFVTVIDPLLFHHNEYSSGVIDFVASFEMVIVTSLGSFDFIRNFRGINHRLIWWLHETEVGFNTIQNMRVNLSVLFGACEAIWLGSPLCLPLASQYTSQKKLHLLLYGCADQSMPHRSHLFGKLIFSIIGSIEQRKGQDIFLNAINQLPHALRKRAVFRIIGSALPNWDSEIFCKKIYADASLIPEVECIPSVPVDKLLEYYAESNVIVSASRDDPMPIAITQGLMFSKLCICSSGIGHALLLEHMKDGLIFSNKSSKELADMIVWAIQNPSKLENIGLAGRLCYEQNFLMSDFVRNVNNLTQIS